MVEPIATVHAYVTTLLFTMADLTPFVKLDREVHPFSVQFEHSIFKLQSELKRGVAR